MSDIFVSYAHEDRARIAPLVARLEAEGWSVWWDRELIPGDRFAQAIDDAIRNARAVVVGWSRAALASQWVHNEALEGLERGILVPVLLETVRVPVAFRQSQAARLPRWPAEYEAAELDALLRGVRGVLGRTPLPENADGSTAGTSELDRSAAIVELHRLTAARDNDALAEFSADVIERFPDDPEIARFWELHSSLYELISEPAGARVSVKPYAHPEREWRQVGVTPLSVRLANGMHRVRLELEGHDPAEIADAVPGLIDLQMIDLLGANPRHVRLQPSDPLRGDMVFVPGGELVHVVAASGIPPKRQTANYWIDRYPVTNADYAEFVAAGGYDDDGLWEDMSADDVGGDRRAVRLGFVDITGRPGPAGWRFGTFPEGKDDFPVTGVSWYEAAAFARFRGGQLPTAAHWNRAARGFLELVSPFSGAVVSQSNFGDRLQGVHASTAVGAFGIRDMAGNAREWARNRMRGGRATLGGSHRDPGYLFIFNAPLDPLSRDDVTGFRTMISLGEDHEHLSRPIPEFGKPRDLTPVGDDVFEILATQLAYTPLPAAERTLEMDAQSERRVLRRFELRYPDGSDLTVFVLMPKDARAPVQPLLVFPGQTAFQSHQPTQPLTLGALGTLVDSGRALLMPIWHGSNERYAGVWQMNADEERIYYRDAQPIWRREMGRVIDWLVTREEFAAAQVAFLGVSYGVAHPLPAAAMEPRFAAYLLLHGGLVPWGRALRAPIADMKNFVPRLTKPCLMLNGRYDSIFPLVCQQALFDRLGTPAEDKTWIQVDGGHALPTEREMLQLVNWLDARFRR